MDEINNDFIRKYPEASRDKFVTIPHGFDREDFEDVKAKKFSKFTIIYTGTFYKGRDPRPLLEATRLLLKENDDLREDLRIVFLGKEYEHTREMIESFGLRDIVRVIQHVPHNEFLEYLMGADICYFNVTERAATTVKLFEYLGSGKPILALIPKECPAAEIITNTQSGVVIPPERTSEASYAILSFYEAHKKGDPSPGKDGQSTSDKYERKTQTRYLAQVLEDMC
jgi:glycosyltransferase involved in cell wall biosynthesis